MQANTHTYIPCKIKYQKKSKSIWAISHLLYSWRIRVQIPTAMYTLGIALCAPVTPAWGDRKRMILGGLLTSQPN